VHWNKGKMHGLGVYGDKNHKKEIYRTTGREAEWFQGTRVRWLDEVASNDDIDA
jgi:hypothetical protein